MSNRLTFSLASLILIFVAGFALLLPSTADAAQLVFDNPNFPDQSITQGVAVDLTLPAATGDADASGITYSVSNLQDGLTFTGSTRKLTGNATGVGQAVVTYTAASSNDDDASQQIIFTVATNQSPTFSPATVTKTFAIGSEVNYQFPAASDPENQTITYAQAGTSPDLPQGLTFNAATRRIIGQPATATATAGVAFIVSATDPVNNSSTYTPSTLAATLTITIKVIETPDKPAAPVGFTATAGVGSATLTWTAVDDTTYEYSTDGTTWMDVASADAGNLTVSGLTGGTEYTFSLRVKADSDNLVPPSDSVTAKATPTTAAPAAPVGFTATAGVGSATLAWTAVDDTTYEYMYTDGTVSSRWITATSPVTVSSLTSGTEYTFSLRVEANATTLAPPSDSVTAKATPTRDAPAAPANFAATAGVESATLTWDTVSGAMYEYSTDGTTWTDVASTDASNLTVSGLTAGTEYTFSLRVKADAATSTPAGAIATDKVTPNAIPDAPAAPANFAATAGVESATLTWDTVSGAMYEYSTDGTTWADVASADAGNLTVSGLTAGTEYTFSLRVKADAATSTPAGAAAVATATPTAPILTPAAPANFAATAGVESATLTWDTVSGAMYEYSTDGTTWADVASADAGNLTVSGLTAGTEYTFSLRVKATGSVSAGNIATAKATPTAKPTVPAAPAGLTAVHGDASVILSWTASTDTSITEYEYSTDGGTAWADIAGSGSTTDSYTVTGLTNGTAYNLYLRAVNSVGNGLSSMVGPITPMAVVAKPGQVTNLTATPGDTSVMLSWTAPATSATSGAPDSYQYSDNSGSTWSPNAGTTTSYNVTGLMNEQTYTFMVRAMNTDRSKTPVVVQYGDPSNQISAKPMKVPPIVDATKPTVTAIVASPNPIDCMEGSTLTFTYSEALAAGESIAANELTVSAGWEAMADGAAVKIVPDGNNALGVTSVTVTVNANAVKDGAGNGNVASAATTFTVGPVFDIPAGSYITVIRPEHRSSTHLNDPLYLGSLGVSGVPISIQEWDCMPDLTVFFGRSGAGSGGGALVVKQSHAHTGAAIGKGSVGISEIMWASDEGTIHGQTSNRMQAREQWVELHNLNSFAVKVTLFARSTTHALVTEGNEIDRASNFEIGNTWVVKGQNGNSALGTDFVSMYRSKNNHNYAHGDNNGKNGGKWHASTLSYRTRTSSLAGSGATNPTYSFKGTPGRSNTISPAGPPVRTNVPNSPVIFNEVANRRDQTLEWIELKNVSTGEVNLRNYHISYVDGVNSEKAFYTFPNNDSTKIPAGGLLLLVDTDPRYNDDHPLAVGRNIHGGNDQALGIGADAPRYMVTNFAEGGLPDGGEFVLMLRRPDGHDKAGTAANKRGTEKNMIDAVGYHPNLNSEAAPLYTKLWPLKVFGAPNKSRSKMEVETVHYRRHKGQDPDQGDNNKAEQIALNNAGYTGVGYKRHAQRIEAHGGTPGYEDTRKNLASEISGTGIVTISEIMFDQGDGRYPQWIELYNSSATQPVNLHGGKTGWKLVIENYDDGEIPIAALSGTLNFRNSDVQTILPQQTVIVASTRARNSGSAFFDTAVVFPPTRVFSVWDDARGELGQQRSTDPILSTQGFYIELIDGGNDARPSGYVSDSVGNLVASPNRRVAAKIEWPLSDITGEMMEDMGRSSILRRYREPKGGDSRTWTPYSAAKLMDMGITAAGWVAAYMTDFREVRETWFGHPDDAGSPGITGGRVLPVELSKFRPERLDDGTIVIRWLTESETNNAGFNILRSENRTGEFTKLNTQLIKGQGTTSERTGYEFVDKTAKPNVVYYYQIQDVSLDGEVAILKVTHLRGHVSAAGKATTTWGELKALQ